MTDSGYKGRIEPDSPSWHKSPWTQLLIERYKLSTCFCKNKFVIDTCSGNGWGTVNFISPLAKYVVALDLIYPYFLKNQNHANSLFCLMDARKISFRHNTFDIALALDSLEHFSRSDAWKYISGIKQVLKKKGVLFGTTPLVEKSYLIPIFLEWNRFHLKMYTENDLRSFLLSHFEHVSIFCIYNEVCPYFLFACSDEKEELNLIRSKITKFTADNRQRFILGKKTAYRLWAVNLLKRGLFSQSLTYFLSSLKKLH